MGKDTNERGKGCYWKRRRKEQKGRGEWREGEEWRGTIDMDDVIRNDGRGLWG